MRKTKHPILAHLVLPSGNDLVCLHDRIAKKKARGTRSVAWARVEDSPGLLASGFRNKIQRVLWSQGMRFSSSVPSRTQEVRHCVFVSLDALAGKAMRAAGDEASKFLAMIWTVL